MRLIVDKHAFQKAISIVEGIIPSRDLRSVISSILLEAMDDRLVLTATDLEIGIKTSIPATVEKKGTITLPARTLSKSVRAFQSQEILFSEDESNTVNLLIPSNTNMASITIMGSPSEEFPVIPTLPDSSYTELDSSIVMEMIRKTSYAVAEEDSRYVFNGLYVSNSDKKLSFVGTDGRRLSRISREVADVLPFQEGVILPNKAVRELQKILDGGASLRIAFNDKERRIYFRVGDYDLISKLIDGQFPDYEQVIPKKLDFIALIDRLKFDQSLMHVSVMAAEPSRQIRMNFQKNMIVMTSTTPDLGGAHYNVECEYAGEEMTIAFNSIYVQDTTHNLVSNNIKIGFSNPNAPTVIQDPDDPEFISVIMPMKI
jgi:DNA polymerase-3 subunit beta